MRRKDKEMIDEKEMLSIIDKVIICRVGMCCQDEPNKGDLRRGR